MLISKYLNIPSRVQERRPYISCFKLLISLITGILLICFRTIQEGMKIQKPQDLFKVLYIFLFVLLFKAAIPINYLCRKKTMKGVRMMNLVIPAFLKSLLYVGLMIGTVFFRDILILLFICINIIVMEVITAIINKCKNFSLGTILASIFTIVSYLLNISHKVQRLDLRTYLIVIIVGPVCLISYYYLHSKAFQIYQQDIDGMIAKEYPIQTINFIIIFVLYCLSRESFNFRQQFMFIIEYPIQIFITVIMSIIYECICFQFLKRINFKQLFQIQLTGLFWFNIFCIFKLSGQKTNEYWSTCFALISLIVSLQLVTLSHFQRIINFLRRMCAKRQQQNEMQEEDEN